MVRYLTLTALACWLILACAAQEKPSAQKTITVTGTAEAEIVPDEIYVQVDLREYDKRGVGKIDIETIKANFLAACESLGIADNAVTMDAYRGADNHWQYQHGGKKDTEMKTAISYCVKLTNLQKFDELVDKLDGEATENISMAKTAYSKETQLKKKLKIDAIRAAKAKAVYLSEAIGEHIGGAITITNENDPLFSFITQMKTFANSGNAFYKPASLKNEPIGNIGFRKIKFQFQVNVVFALN